jgi:hypothetical protein
MEPREGDLERLVHDAIETGNVDPAALMEQLGAADPATVARAQQMLEDAGAGEIGYGQPLNIADFYREGPEKFTPRWPVWNPLDVAFDDLDRKTQFFVLFSDWTRRDLEGLSQLNSGALEDAEATFEECVERARQIGVNELVARSYEDLMRVAEKRGDAAQASEWSGKAEAARRAG